MTDLPPRGRSLVNNSRSLPEEFGFGNYTLSSYMMATTPKESSFYSVLRRGTVAVLRRLGATETAVVLIVVLALVLALATVLDRAGGMAFIRWNIYDSRWFAALFVLLGINIVAAVLVRFPWSRQQAGFLATHAGLLVVLLGMAQSFRGGIEGWLALEEGSTAHSIYLTDRNELRVTRLDKAPPHSFVFHFSSKPGDWTANRPLDLGVADEVEICVLKFRRQEKPADRSSSTEFVEQTFGVPKCSALVALRANGDTEQVWLECNGQGRAIQTSAGRIELALTNECLRLGFSLDLIQFQRKRNPGGIGDASFVSKLRLVDKQGSVMRSVDVSMNKPLSHRGFLFYQVGFLEVSGGRNVSVLGVTRDPGRTLKYLGVAMVCIGTVLTFLMRIAYPSQLSTPNSNGNPVPQTESPEAASGVS